MAKKFASLMTEKGKALIAEAIAGGNTISLKYFAVGDGNGSEITPSSDQTSLVNEVARVEINSIKETDPTAQVVAAEAIIPADKGGFWIREAGIFTDDGVLVAVSQMPVTYKPAASEGASSSQIVRMLMAVSNASAVEISVDDSIVIATEEFVNDKLKAHEESRNHPDGTLKDKGFVQLSSATNSDDETKAATPKAVKAANDNADTRLKASENLSDLPDAAKARDSLGLGSAAQKNTDDFYPANGGNLDEGASVSVISGDNNNPAAGDVLYSPMFRTVLKGRGGDQDFKDGASFFMRLVEHVGTLAYGEIVWDGFGSTHSFRFKQNGDIQTDGNIEAGNGARFGASVNIVWGDNGHAYQEDGNIVHQSGNNSIFGTFGGATSLSGALTNINNNAVQDVAMGNRNYTKWVNGTPDWTGLIPAGGVCIAALTEGDDRITRGVWSYLCKNVNGNWFTCGQVKIG